jgi:1,4-dihydroxy-2-naphthoate octaprenyltransferase
MVKKNSTQAWFLAARPKTLTVAATPILERLYETLVCVKDKNLYLWVNNLTTVRLITSMHVTCRSK